MRVICPVQSIISRHTQSAYTFDDLPRRFQDGSRSDDDNVAPRFLLLCLFTQLMYYSVDNSEHTRNGDFTPTRFGAQADAVNLIFNVKMQANPESTVGIMTLAGAVYGPPSQSHLLKADNRPEVKITMTRDQGKILNAMHAIKISGSPNFTSAIQIAGVFQP